MELIPIIICAFAFMVIMIAAANAKQKGEKQSQQRQSQRMKQLQGMPSAASQGTMPTGSGSQRPMTGPTFQRPRSQRPMSGPELKEPDSRASLMRERQASGRKKPKEDGMKAFRALEDRNNDWLAKQLREEKLYEWKFSAMYGLKRQHAANCDADRLRRDHEENCDAEELRRVSRR